MKNIVMGRYIISGRAKFGLLLLAFFQFFSSEIHAEVQERVVISELPKALETLSKRFDVIFSYDWDLVKDIKIEVDIRKRSTLDDIIRQITQKTDLVIEEVGTKIFVVYSRLPMEKINLPGSMGSQVKQLNKRPGMGLKSIVQDEIHILQPIFKSISGKVMDGDGAPLIGVNVIEKGTANGTATDLDGTYSIEVVGAEAILQFSYIGYENQEVLVGTKSEIVVSMLADAKALDEVIVVGYGTMKKSDLTGAVSSVGENALGIFPASSAVHALQGKAAGVVVQSTNGEPGGQFKIRVRGSTSINANSDPLFVVDGFVAGSLPPAEDIASMEVLKDASATAIYGSRGANGVIMVTTKSGKAGRTLINYNSYYSFHKEIGRLKLLGARDFAEYINEARDAPFYDLNALEFDTDWQDLVFRPGSAQSHQVSISGGSEKIRYYLSGIYFDQKGVIKESDFDRLSLSTNLNFDASDHLSIKLNSTIRGTNRSGIPTQTGGIANNSGVISAAQRFDPNQGVLDSDGAYTKSKVGIAAFENPVALLDGRVEEDLQDVIQTNIQGKYQLTDNLIFNSTAGVNISNSRDGLYNSTITNLGEGSFGRGQLTYRKNLNFLTEQYLNYDMGLGQRSSLVLTGGYSYQKFKSESLTALNTGFISDALSFWNLGVGTNLEAPSSGITRSEISSFYGRVNYGYENRYLLTFTGRYDGASQFSVGNKWSFFPSGALSWNIGNEDFFPNNNIISNLKLRISYGLTGNQGISSYQSLARLSATYFVINNNPVSSIRPTSIANKDLTWETTAQFNVGLDIELFDGRLSLTTEYYDKKTNDLLFDVPIPSFSGFQRRLDNLGEIENRGVELQMAGKILVNDVKWDAAFNLTVNRNRVLSLPNGAEVIFSSAPSQPSSVPNSILREGEPVGSFYGYVYEGVYQEGDEFVLGGAFESTPGGEKYVDLNGDGVLDTKDRRIIGDPNPNFIWGLNNDLSYRGINVNIFFQAYVGGDMLNIARMELDRLSGNSNATVLALNRWTPSNIDTDVPKATSDRAARTSTRFVEDGSFVRLKNISLGYELPVQWLSNMKIRSARIYMSGQNLLTFSDYSGVDPEVAFRSSNTNLGLDFGSYPSVKSFTIGVNVGF